MCLKVVINKLTDLQPKIANKDIICYKIMQMHKPYNRLHSLYQDFPYDRGKKYTLKLSKRDTTDKNACFTTNDSFVQIYKEFHSYVKRINVIDKLNRLNNNVKDISNFGLISIKCIIPKSSSYYKGDFNNMESYVSDTIIIGKRIFKNQY